MPYTGHIHRPPTMGIPPVDAQTTYFDADTLSFGVEYRLLTDDIYEANFKRQRVDEHTGKKPTNLLDDRGVSIHVFGSELGHKMEVLRFDCFDGDAHYHYIQPSGEYQEILHMDTFADGDPLAWALERLRTRLPQMLARAGATKLAQRVNFGAVDAALPKVADAAYRARFHRPDSKKVLADALKAA